MGLSMKSETQTPRYTAQDWALMLTHILLALMAPVLLFSLASCRSNDMGEPVDYGPPVQWSAIGDALVASIADSDPVNTKLGAFVHFATTQTIAGGQVTTVISDTGQTLVKKERLDTETEVFTIVQHKITYTQDQPQKVSTQIELPFYSPESVSPLMAVEPFLRKLASDQVSAKSEAQSPVTFHRLITENYEGPPPYAIQQAPDCLGIPNCRIRYRKVSFDQVLWDDPMGDRIHFDIVVSPDVPQIAGLNMSPLFYSDDIGLSYFPGLVKSCMTFMTPIGDGKSRTLFTECQEVVNFRFELDTP